MASAPKPVPVVPNRGIPHTLGILNIVFASGLLLCGLCTGGSQVMSPWMMKSFEQAQMKQQEAERARQEQAVKELKAQEKAAQTEAEKAEIRAAINEARGRSSAVPVMDWTKLGLIDPRLTAWTWVEVLTNLAVNGMLLASGIGLVAYRRWGRRLGVWTAGVKIARLALVWGYFGVVLVPVISSKIGTLVAGSIAAQQPPGKPLPPMFTAEYFTRMYVITYSVISVGMIVVGSVYPALLLWLLNKRSVRAACGDMPAPPPPPGEELE